MINWEAKYKELNTKYKQLDEAYLRLLDSFERLTYSERESRNKFKELLIDILGR